VVLGITTGGADEEPNGASTVLTTTTTTTEPVPPPDEAGPEVRQAADRVAAVAESIELPGSQPWERAYATAATGYVDFHLSPEVFADRERKGLATPVTAEEALRQGAGLCGNATEALMAILAERDIDARAVEFFVTVDGIRISHVGVEARWDGSWHYLDPTYGAIFVRDGEVLSIESVLADPTPARLVRSVTPDRPFDTLGIDYLLDVIDAAPSGNVAVPPEATVEPDSRGLPNGDARFILEAFPSAIGGVSGYGGVPVRYDWTLKTDRRTTVTMRVTATSCDPASRLVARSADGRETSVSVMELDSPDRTMTVPRAPAVTLSIDDSGPPCHVQLDALSASAN
jgi:hypothetical protein